MNNMDQRSFIYEYNNTHREKFNEEFFRKSEDDIIEYLKKVILSCQREKFFILKVKKFTVVDNYTEIQKILKKYEADKNKNKSPNYLNTYDYINLKDSAIKLLLVDYYIESKNENAKKPEDKYANIQVIIAVPRIVDKYHFRISGNLYTPMYQIVDGSTYNNSSSKSNSQSVTFKTMFMASRLYRYNNILKTTTGESLRVIHYQSIIFKKSMPVLKYVLGKYGLYQTQRMLKAEQVFISTEDPRDEDMYTFTKHGIFVSSPKFIFDNDTVVQSLVYTILDSISKDTNYSEIYTIEYWLKSLGETYNSKTIEKGEAILDSLEFIYDIPAEENIRLPLEDKDEIYKIIVWLVREFNNLRVKDNLDIGTKRVRWAEYIAALYAIKLSNGILRISDEGYKVSLKSIISAITIYPEYLLKAITKDRLVNYKDGANDLDSIHTLKYTYKGISGLGENKNSSIPIAYRQVHPSHVGRVDLNAATPTDPGLTGLICPMADIYDNYFSDYEEPNTWKEEIDELIRKYQKLSGLKEVLKFQDSIGIETDQNQKEFIDESLSILDNLICPIAYVDSKEDGMLLVEETNL